ncbi:hypothetical protein CSOJ01_09758 [Colletotrichum sojae]|uniref:Uncharacterized protein n=1 Tax=Colletotrichum sojae TaxID=2175907 RepID=A0A8H6MQ62_9PEZI|nr:hypothetical protein CSOJ01_09758 [Colletotrichum sojae]
MTTPLPTTSDQRPPPTAPVTWDGAVRWAAAATGRSTGRRYAGGSSAAQSLKHLAGLALQGGTLFTVFSPSLSGPYRPYRSSHMPRITHLDNHNHETQTTTTGGAAVRTRPPLHHTAATLELPARALPASP